MNMHVGHSVFDRLSDIDVIVTVKVGVNAALQSDFGST